MGRPSDIQHVWLYNCSIKNDDISNILLLHAANISISDKIETIQYNILAKAGIISAACKGTFGIFRFFEPFRARLASKLAKKGKKDSSFNSAFFHLSWLRL